MAKASTSKKTKTSAKRKPGGSASAKTRSGKSGKSKKKVAAASKRSEKPASAARKTSKQKASRKATSRQKASRPTVSKKTTSRQKTSKPKISKKTAAGASPRRAAGTSKSRVSAAKSAAPARGTKAGKPAPKPRTKQPQKSAPATAAPVASKSAARKKAAEAVQKSASGKGSSAPPAPEAVMVSVEDAMANLPYVEGQFVVHPKYGLGRVNRILERKLSTRTVPCLEIGFSYQEMKLTIPVDQVDRSGLRRPIGKKSIDDVFKVLRGRATFDAKRRSAKRVVDYRKRLGQGDPTSLAEAVRDLARLSLRKSLSYEERKILSTALRILSREVALARGREPDDVREEIEKIVYR